MPLQYHAEMTWTNGYGDMNPKGWILRGSDGLGNRPLGFVAFGSQTANDIQQELEEEWAMAMAGAYGPYVEGILPEGWAKVRSDIIDSYMPDAY